MDRNMTRKWMRVISCITLAALLGACGYAGAKPQPVQTVQVPVAVQTISQSELSAESLEETKARLLERREAALLHLQAVLDHPGASPDAVNSALLEKTRIASAMEKEAALCAVLQQMGFGETMVMIGTDSVSVIAPWQTAENEQNRMQIIDAAVSQTGFSAECIKIILAKK